MKGARLYRRDVTSSVYLPENVLFQETRRRNIKNAQSANLEVRQVNDFKTYWEILETNLARRHKVKPTHTLEEITYLHDKFPDKIKLFASYQDEIMLAGVVVYETNVNVAHSQYIACIEAGKKVGALDIIFEYLINEYYKYQKPKKYFDFGISTENEGRYLNEGLIFQKEGFGARAVVHDFYELNVK